MIVAPTLVACPDCEGEGRLEYEVSGGHYDDHLGQWYPTWEMRTCVTCRGTGGSHRLPALLPRPLLLRRQNLASPSEAKAKGRHAMDPNEWKELLCQ